MDCDHRWYRRWYTDFLPLVGIAAAWKTGRSGPPSGSVPPWRLAQAQTQAQTPVGYEYGVLIFHVCLFPLFVLAFGELSSLRTHFRPFTEVMRKSRREVTQEVRFARLNR